MTEEMLFDFTLWLSHLLTAKSLITLMFVLVGVALVGMAWSVYGGPKKN
jgi:hypothetical protein